MNDTEKLRKNNTTGVTGVYYNSKIQRYIARIYEKKKNINLGQFKTLEEAKKARELAEDKYFKPIIDKYKLD